MIPRVTTVVMLAVLVAGPAGADEPKPGMFQLEQSDHAKLQGTWKAEKMVFDGANLLGGEVGKLTIEFKGLKAVPRFDGRIEKEGDFKLNTGRKPKAVTVAFAGGPRLLGIYDITGDTLKLCFSILQDGSRPTKFEAPSGSQSVLLVLKRQKK